MDESRSSQRRSEYVKQFHGSMWEEIEALVVAHQAVNLGKGFPNWQAPEFVKRFAVKAIENDLNQYTRSLGHLKLTKTISQVFSPLIGREIDPFKEVITTVGAAESLFIAFQSIINPGDEVILLEPFFDFYIDQVKILGGVPVGVPLLVKKDSVAGNRSSADFVIPYDQLEAAITAKTRIIVINSPHNPTGKIFHREELEKIAEIAIKHDLIVISDEVYEWMDLSATHIRLASLPGMWDRTLTIGSAGKTFSVTGWKLGWTYGPADLIEGMWLSHQRTVFTISTPMQEAIADSFQEALQNNYFVEFRKLLLEKRDRACAFLRKAGLDPFVPEGSYMMLVDCSNYALDPEFQSSRTEDVDRCKQLICKHHVASIPPSLFYTDKHKPLAKNFLRFCFCKTDEVLAAAEEKFLLLGQSQ